MTASSHRASTANAFPMPHGALPKSCHLLCWLVCGPVRPLTGRPTSCCRTRTSSWLATGTGQVGAAGQAAVAGGTTRWLTARPFGTEPLFGARPEGVLLRVVNALWSTGS